MRPLPVHVGGRTLADPQGGSWRHSWPGTYFEAAFVGRSVTLKFDDDANEYRLLVDGGEPMSLDRPGRAAVGVRGLGPGRHRLRLEKVTINSNRPRAFQGFYIPPDGTPLPAPARLRRIEFIGDSSMNGHGNRSATAQCTSEEVRLRSDTQRAWPALVARHFDADYQINAVSGRGLIRNYAGNLPGQELPRVYPRALVFGSEPYDDPDWRPQLIVIRLQADFVGDLKPGEQWPSWEALLPDYAAAYGAFVADLHRRHPGAAFLIWWFDTEGMRDLNAAIQLDAARKTVEQAARSAGVASIDFLPTRHLSADRSACGHPSLAGHRDTADWLIAYIEARLQLWQGK